MRQQLVAVLLLSFVSSFFSFCTGITCYPDTLEESTRVLSSPGSTKLNSGGHNVTIFPELAFGCSLAVSHVRLTTSDRDTLCSIASRRWLLFQVELWRAVGSSFVQETVLLANQSSAGITRQCENTPPSSPDSIITLDFLIQRRNNNLLANVKPGYIVGLQFPLQLTIVPADGSIKSSVNLSLVYQKTLQSALYLPNEDVNATAPLSALPEFLPWSIYLAPQIGFLIDASNIGFGNTQPDGPPASAWEHTATLVLAFFTLIGIITNLILFVCLYIFRFKVKVCTRVKENKNEGSSYYSYPRALTTGRPPVPVVRSQPLDSPRAQPYIFPKPQTAYVNCTPGRRPAHINISATPSSRFARSNGNNHILNTNSSTTSSSTTSTNSTVPSTVENRESPSDPVYEDTSISTVDSPSSGSQEHHHSASSTGRSSKKLFPFK